MRYTHRLCEHTWAQVASGPPTDSRRIVKALLYGTRPEQWTPPDPDNRLLAGLAQVPMRLVETDPPRPERRGWCVLKTRMTGICGSDAKQVFMDFGEGLADSALNGLFSFPTVLGHEVVADVVETGDGYEGPPIGTRVVLNPWLSCVPRGIDPPCGSCRDGELSLCWHFTEGDLAPGIHTGTCRDAPVGSPTSAGSRDDDPSGPRQCLRRGRRLGRPFLRVAHSVTRHSPPGGRVLIYGAGALGTTALAILKALHPDVEVGVSPVTLLRPSWHVDSVRRYSARAGR